MTDPRTADLLPWLLARTVLVGECWEWTGGYGGGNRRNGCPPRPYCWWAGKTHLVARVVLCWQLGRLLQPDLLAGHTCDNPKCVRPDHLQENTYSQNLADAYARGRRPSLLVG